MKFTALIIVALLVLIGLYFYFLNGQSTYDGYYKTKGYGFVFEIKNGRLKTYQKSGDKLVYFELFEGRIRNDLLKTFIVNLRFTKTDTGFDAKNDLGTLFFSAEKLDSLDGYEIVDDKADATENFEIFWETFNENYPFFDLYDIDWDERKAMYQDRVDHTTSDEELAEIFMLMLEGLNDDHIMVTVNENERTPYKDLPKWHKDSMSRPLVEVIEKQYVPQIIYSEDKYIRHGLLDDQTGYILIATFGGYMNEPEATRKISAAFSTALKDMGRRKIVLDLRFNRGGFDRVGLELSSFFTKEKTLVYSREVRAGDIYAEMTPVYSYPNNEKVYENDVIILTSGATVSAAETFIVAMKEVANVTIVGENTAGFYSDMLDRVLPNGMHYGLSHIKYYSASGELLEGYPIVPDVLIPIDLDAMKNKIDPALDFVLSMD